MQLSPIMAVAVFCAYFAKGICGFGNTLVFGSVMAFSADNINISPIDLIVSYPSDIIIAARKRKLIDWKVFAIMSACMLVGNLPGVFLLKTGDARVLKVVFGLVVAAIGLEAILHRSRGERKKPGLPVMLIVGLVSGVLCGLFGIGALMAACVSRLTDSADAFKGTHNAIFAVEGVMRITLYSLTGIITLTTVKTALCLMPVMLLALWVGGLVSKRTSEKHARLIINIMLAISGLYLCVANIVSFI